MSEPFVAEIRMVGFNFAPRNWAVCNGALLSISQNTALFSLVGTFYGGNGLNTFGLPDLQGRAAIHQGQGPGLTQRFVGEQGGSAAVTLLSSQLPAHSHNTVLGAATGGVETPGGNDWGSALRGRPPAYSTTSNTTMSASATSTAGGSQPHNNMPPYLSVLYIIALSGVFPARN